MSTEMTLQELATEWCASCDTRQPLEHLTEVVNLQTGEVFHVCRPVLQGNCFKRGVGSRRVHSIRATRP